MPGGPTVAGEVPPCVERWEAVVESTTDLPADATAAGHARRFVRSWLLSRHLDAAVDTVELLTSEVVTNAVLHTASSASLAIAKVETTSGTSVLVEVRDKSPQLPSVKAHSLMSGTGRGTQLLQSLATEWGSRPTADRSPGKIVWFTAAIPHTAGPGTSATRCASGASS